MRTICLQGEPGSGKSRMGCLTAVNKPVHVVDIDCKIAGAGWAQAALKSGELTYWEVSEPIDDSNLKSRMLGLSKDLKTARPTIEPKGWALMAELAYRLPKDEVSMRAGTWMFDCLTLANEHAKSMIMHGAGRSKFTFDQWTNLKICWMQTISVWRDLARENGKDLIFTVHERFKEEPGELTKGVRLEAVSSGGDTALQKTYVGQQDIAVWAAIDGQFGQLIGGLTDEYYWLYVDASNRDKPVWKCRVWPDGRRALRTSFMLDKAEWEPDFRKIWR